MGRTSLETIPNTVFDRDFEACKKEYEAAKEAAAAQKK